MNINIRHERPEDYKRVEEITREAFWNLYFPGCSEHYVIHQMRQHNDYIKDLSFVIEVDGEIVGSIFYSKSKIVTNNSDLVHTVTFGPVSISPKMHRMGLGKKLIEYTIKRAKDDGHKAILTLGYPYHYAPYGFKGGKNYDISMPDGKFYKGLLILPLYDGALNGISGYAEFSDVFTEPDKDTLEKFDSQFPYMEKAYKASQREFEEVSMQLDE